MTDKKSEEANHFEDAVAAILRAPKKDVERELEREKKGRAKARSKKAARRAS